MTSLLAFIGGIGAPELFFFMVIVLLLFGHRLPSVMRSMGRGITEFKKGVRGEGDDLGDDETGDRIESAQVRSAPAERASKEA
jgi:sec-independent protein translocase protein TatA